MEPAEILEKGAAELQARGMVKGTFRSSATGEVCMMGAMRMAAFKAVTPQLFTEEYRIALAELAAVCKAQYTSFAAQPGFLPPADDFEWIAMSNDDPSTTEEQAVALLEKAAVNLRSAQ